MEDDFEARSTDELTLRRGDRIALVELDDGFGDGWYLGKHLGSGGTGLFPGGEFLHALVFGVLLTCHFCVAVYTTKLPTGLPSLRTGGPNLRASLPSQPFAFQTSSASPLSQDARPISLAATQSAPHQASQHTGVPTLPQNAVLPADQTLYTSPEARRPPSTAVASAASMPNIQRSISETIGQSRTGQDSPVMNETLNVIDEHMNDLSTPRHIAPAQEARASNDSDSEYSSHLGSQPSFLAGLDSDDEDREIGGRIRETEVKRWNPQQTAAHLRKIGIEADHCDIFEEQEISGEVLLEMDQQFIYMKEYDFGLMGRRLKTWHKVRDFQDKVKGPGASRRKTSITPVQAGSSEDLGQTHTRAGSTTASFLPRIPSLMEERPGLDTRQHPLNTAMYSDMESIPPPLQTQSFTANSPRANTITSPSASAWRVSAGPESPSRPSAASIRELNHSRRHSSMDSGSLRALEGLNRPTLPHIFTHKKQSSLDHDWSLSSAMPTVNDSMAGSCKSCSTAIFQLLISLASPLKLSTIQQEINDQSSDPSLLIDPSSVDLDRGYFSGGELESRKVRNVLRKRDSTGSPGHSRVSSYLDDQKRGPSALRRQSRLGSADSIRDFVPQVTSPASKAYHSNTFKGRLRSASARTPTRNVSNDGLSPTVTNLEEGVAQSRLSPSSRTGNESSRSVSPLPIASSKMSMSNKARRVMGLRAISDAVTGNEKALVTSPNTIPSPVKESPIDSPARTGSTTPSIASKSLEIDNTDASSRGTDGASILVQSRPPNRRRAKSKKETSAYTRGLLKTTPAEQRIGCDYSGWMKKKSSSLVTTWKPRLFVLRGRRLSYYYSEDDTEERGVIDISSHKVLVANKDPITTFHATITGAASSSNPSSGPSAQITLDDTSSVSRSLPKSPFYFKLVPPKIGLSRAVQFTKPTVHYFQVDSIVEGRKWMGEMMKATIEHTAVNFETTNKQKTISLVKARARKERPPALQETEEIQENIGSVPKSGEAGLNIHGLSFNEAKRDMEPSSLALEKVNSLGAINSSHTIRIPADTGQQNGGLKNLGAT